MSANWIKETTTSTGTGSLTLSAITGSPRFRDGVAIGQPFKYSIHDSNDYPIEAGTGHLTAVDTLARDRVESSYVGGVYTTYPGSPVTLGAGTKTVRLVHTADAVVGSWKSYAFADDDKRIVGIDAINTGSINTLTLAANKLVLYPFHIRAAASVDKIFAEITTGAAGNARLGVYFPDAATGAPGTLAIDSGDLSTATATTISASVGPVHLPPGWYWAGILLSSAAVVRATGTVYVGDDPLGWNIGTYRYKNIRLDISQTYGALPTTCPTPLSMEVIHSGTSNTRPLISLRVL